MIQLKNVKMNKYVKEHVISSDYKIAQSEHENSKNELVSV